MLKNMKIKHDMSELPVCSGGRPPLLISGVGKVHSLHELVQSPVHEIKKELVPFIVHHSKKCN